MGGGDPINDRSIPDQQAIASALEQAAAAVHQLGDAREQRWLRYLADDPNTVEPARTAMQRILAPAPDAAADAHHDGAAGASTEGSDTATAPGIPPARLSRELVRDGFAPAREAMMHCLDHASSRPSQVRLSFRYDGAGALSNVTVTPAQFAPCIGPIAAGVHLPASQVSQEIGTYYLLGDAP